MESMWAASVQVSFHCAKRKLKLWLFGFCFLLRPRSNAVRGILAGWSFDSETALVEHIEAMRPREDSTLHVVDSLLLFHLVMEDEEFSQISQPIRCLRKSSEPESTFSAELEDGSQMTIPWQRAVRLASDRKRALGGKDSFAMDSWQTGQILEIRGLREGTTFSMVRLALAHFGNVPYVEVLRIPPGARLHRCSSGSAPTATARCRFESAAACCRAANELKAMMT